MKYDNEILDKAGYTDLDIIEIYTDILKDIDTVERTQKEIKYIKERFINLIK